MRNVAVRCDQHSVMFGHLALRQMVLRLCRSRSAATEK